MRGWFLICLHICWIVVAETLCDLSMLTQVDIDESARCVLIKASIIHSYILAHRTSDKFRETVYIWGLEEIMLLNMSLTQYYIYIDAFKRHQYLHKKYLHKNRDKIFKRNANQKRMTQNTDIDKPRADNISTSLLIHSILSRLHIFIYMH